MNDFFYWLFYLLVNDTGLAIGTRSPSYQYDHYVSLMYLKRMIGPVLCVGLDSVTI